jgi:phosphatidylserine decarboxylase
MNEFVKHPNAPLSYEGWPIIAVGALLTVILSVAYLIWGPCCVWAKVFFGVTAVAALLFTAFSVWFFRNPERTPADTSSNAVISAADGTVLKVERVNDPRYGEPSEKISIFMSPFNVHVNRAPVTGTVEKVEYVPGKFLVASLDKASTDNERNLAIIKTQSGHRVGFLQIAGLIARRIACSIKAGDQINVGQRYGLIRFGSRMEMFLPVGSTIFVKAGDVVEGGNTVVGRLP